MRCSENSLFIDYTRSRKMLKKLFTPQGHPYNKAIKFFEQLAHLEQFSDKYFWNINQIIKLCWEALSGSLAK